MTDLKQAPRAKEAGDRLAEAPRWLRWALERPTLLRRSSLGLSLAIVAVSAIIFTRTILAIDPGQFATAIEATSAHQIFMSFALATLSYLALTGYDGLALRHLEIKVPYRLTALASFTSYAVSFTLGFPLVTGGAVRYWIYGPAGLSPGKVANLTIIAGITFWLGMGFIVGAGFIVQSDAIAEINHLNPTVNILIGLGVFSALFAYLIWVSRVSKPGFMNVTLPGPVLTLCQMALGVTDVCAAAGALYVLLPAGAWLGFVPFSALYSFACMLGIASHAPGGLGVFEATMIKGVGGSSNALLASLLLFRAIYYLAPFILAMALLGANEAVRRWRSLRDAMTASEEDQAP